MNKELIERLKAQRDRLHQIRLRALKINDPDEICEIDDEIAEIESEIKELS